VVSNLKPRKLRGELSVGMILAVHDKNGLKLLSIDEDITPGSRIS